MKKDTIDWESVNCLSYIKAGRLRRLEGILAESPGGIRGEDLCRKLGFSGDGSIRTLQNDLKDLRALYTGNQKISRSPHKLQLNGDDRAFPEQAFNTNDRRQLNTICRLITFFDGAIPLKTLLQATGTRIQEVQNALNDFSENIDVPTSRHEISHIKDMYDAIENRLLLDIVYPRLNDGRPFTFAPYFLKRHNNKWFAIGRMYVDNPFEWTSIPIAGIEALTPYKGVKSYIPQEDDKLAALKKRIKLYYDKVIGFHVPTNETDPDKVPRKLNPETLPIRTIRLKFAPHALRFVKENPIHECQTVDDALCEVNLNVVINPLLKQRILSYGSEVEVISPEELRTDIRLSIEKMAEIYKTK